MTKHSWFLAEFIHFKLERWEIEDSWLIDHVKAQKFPKRKFLCRQGEGAGLEMFTNRNCGRISHLISSEKSHHENLPCREGKGPQWCTGNFRVQRIFETFNVVRIRSTACELHSKLFHILNPKNVFSVVCDFLREQKDEISTYMHQSRKKSMKFTIVLSKITSREINLVALPGSNI